MSNPEDAMRIIDDLGFPDDFTKMLKPFVKAALEAQRERMEKQARARPFKVGDWIIYQTNGGQEYLQQITQIQDDLLYTSHGNSHRSCFYRQAKPEDMFKKGAMVCAKWDGFILTGRCDGHNQFMGTVIFKIFSAEPKVPCDVSFHVPEYDCTLLEPAPGNGR